MLGNLSLYEMPVPDQVVPGMFFTLKINFTESRYKGFVYRVGETECIRLDRDLRKECASKTAADTLPADHATLIDWANQGYIAFVDLSMLIGGPNRQLTGKSNAVVSDHNSAEDAAKCQAKIQKQIDSTRKKIASLSGNYLTNTRKRMRQQEQRDKNIQAFNFDLQILTYLHGLCDQRALSPLENALVVKSFRDELHYYYTRHTTPTEERYSCWKEVEYPQLNPDSPDWVNDDIPRKQRSLSRAGIYNTTDLLNAISDYAAILQNAVKPIDYTQQEIKRRENKCKLYQKGDIQFTPDDVARRLVSAARIDADSIVLEPSAGIGSIADIIREYTQHIDVVEICGEFHELLELKGYNVVGWDFLQYETDKRYSHIIMNPPFSKNQDIVHVKHAYSLLAPGGVLVSITSPHWTFAREKKCEEFRSWLGTCRHSVDDLGSGTFDMTGVASKILTIHKAAQEKKESA